MPEHRKPLAETKAKVLARLSQERQEYALETPAWADVDSNQVQRWIIEDPPPQRFLFDGVLPAGIVAELAGPGGAGKSFLLIAIALALVLALRFGPFKPIKQAQALYFGFEDSESELWRRFRTVALNWGLAPAQAAGIAVNLGAYSLAGKTGPIIALDQSGNPAVTPAFDGLVGALEQHPGTNLLILDPKSRLCGLPENDNVAQTAFIAALERLLVAFPGLTILFAHHSPKGSDQGRMTAASASRGGSALVDGARWLAGLRPMTETDGEAYGVDNPRQYVELDLLKTNYTPGWPGHVFFKRGEGGVLEPVDLHGDRLRSVAEALCFALQADGGGYSCRDLSRGQGAPLLKAMKKDVPGLSKPLVVKAATWALEAGLLELVPIPGNSQKQALRVVRQ